MTKQNNYKVDKNSEAEFTNNMDYCIGTGRMDLAMQKEYLDELKLVQKEIGFKHIRGHGLFCDQMAIYQEYIDLEGNTKAEYNFTYLDRVMDSYRELGLKPFIELGFMPSKLASGKQTVFYWKGNTTPPSDYDKWCDLVIATLQHFIDRYGLEAALSFPIEVWNEPNLPGFWENADMEEYFKLFEVTFKAIKNFNSKFRVGGPAVCGGTDEKWIRAFCEFCDSKDLDIDFITRHHYNTDFPVNEGHYGYAKLTEPKKGYENLHTTREIADSFDRFKEIEIHITEFNTSYIPNCCIHDTNQNAAYLADQLSNLGNENESYSYWTFGDVFEENGVPFTPFHGGFGLVANGCIPKPTFWTFAFYKKLIGKCVLHDENIIVVKGDDGAYRGIAWNLDISDRTTSEIGILLDTDFGDSKVSLVIKTVDEQKCNPLKLWHDLGEPSSLNANQLELLRQEARPFINSETLTAVDGEIDLKLWLESNAVVYFELSKIKTASDRGFDYERTTVRIQSK